MMEKEIKRKFVEVLKAKSTSIDVRDNANQVRAYLDEAGKWIYFLLVPDGDKKWYQLQFWIDTPATNRGELQKRLLEFVQRNSRQYELISYYSALGCRLRVRTDTSNINEDVKSFFDVITKNVLKNNMEQSGKPIDINGSIVAEEPLSLPIQCALKDVAAMLNAGAEPSEKQNYKKTD